MAFLTTQYIDKDGESVSFIAATTTDHFEADRSVTLHIANFNLTDATAHIQFAALCNAGFQHTDDRTVVAAQETLIGNLDPGVYGQREVGHIGQWVQVHWSSPTNLFIAATRSIPVDSTAQDIVAKNEQQGDPYQGARIDH